MTQIANGQKPLTPDNVVPFAPNWEGSAAPRLANEEPVDTMAMVAAEISTLRDEVKGLRAAMESIQAIQSPLVGIDQIAQHFGRTPETIRRWVKERLISCYRIPNKKGDTLLFSFRMLEEDLEDYRQDRM